MLKKIAALACALTFAFAFVSCDQQNPEENPGEGTKLRKPSLAIAEMTAESFTISWSAIDNATSYIYALGEDAEASTDSTFVTFTGKELGQEYTISVRAVAEGYEDSPVATMTFIYQVRIDPYVGEWTVSADMYFTWEQGDDGYLYPALGMNSIQRTVTIQDMHDEYPEDIEPGLMYCVFGLSEVAPGWPIYAYYVDDFDGKGSEGIAFYATQMTEFAPTEFSDGSTENACIAWAPLLEYKDVDSLGNEETYIYPLDSLNGENGMDGFPVFMFMLDEEDTNKGVLLSLLNQVNGEELAAAGAEMFGFIEPQDMFIYNAANGGFAKALIGYELPIEKTATKSGSFSIAPQWNRADLRNEISFPKRK